MKELNDILKRMAKYHYVVYECSGEFLESIQIKIKQLKADLLEHNKDTNKVVAENQRLKTQIEQFKKNYPFFDDADSGSYTLKDGKVLEDKDE